MHCHNYFKFSQQSYSCTNTAEVTYTIVVRDQCSDTEVTIDSGSMRDYNIPYTMNCTNITIIAENSVGTSPSHSVNTTSPGESVSSRDTNFVILHFQITVPDQYRCVHWVSNTIHMYFVVTLVIIVTSISSQNIPTMSPSMGSVSPGSPSSGRHIHCRLR